jgi:ketosteroid isomerase-like protein/quercetin dioxygenase-like cupin family protein
MGSTRQAASSTVRIDNGRVRATEWSFERNAETGWHRHGHDYVVVPLADGRLLLEEPGGGTRTSELKLGVPYARPEGVEHNVVNDSDGGFSFLEIELLDDELSRRRKALLERFADAWNAHDVDTLMACMAEDCAFMAAAGAAVDGTTYRGRDAVRAGYAAVFEAFPDAAWNEPSHFVFGDRGLSAWRFTGTDKTGARTEVFGCDLFEFDGDLIRSKNSFRKQRK